MSLDGQFSPPGDKSVYHRVALFSLLARGRCRVENYSPCADCASSLGAVRALGGEVAQGEGGLILRGRGGELVPRAEIDCGNSGTTMRLLMGILAGSPGPYRLDGDESLRRRPMARVARPLEQMGARVNCAPGGRPPVEISGGGLTGIRYRLPVASAQLKSALLLAGLRARGVTVVEEPVKSRDHTELMLGQWGASIQAREGRWELRPSPLTLPPEFYVPGDPSSAAFFLCAAAVIPGSRVRARGVLLNPTRTGFLQVLERMGAGMDIRLRGREPEPWGDIGVAHTPALRACTVEAREIPGLVDEVPILALVASQARGTTVFREVEELRIKESDRLGALESQLGAMGARIRTAGRDLVVEGPTPLRLAGELDSQGDHRIAMTLALAGLLAGGRARIRDEQCAAVSFPDFWRVLEELRS